MANAARPASGEAADAMRAAGLRITAQRLAVLDAVRGIGGHVTVERIAASLRGSSPPVDVATVYRAVGLLSRLHLLNEVSIGGVSHYEYADPGLRHGHLVCEHCGAAAHAPSARLDELRERLLRDVGFDLHVEHLTLSGLCEACREDEAHSHSGHTHAQSQRHEHAR